MNVPSLKQVPVPSTRYSTTGIAAHASFCCHGTFVNLVFYIQDLVYIYIYSHLEYNFVLRSSILLRGVYDCTPWEFRESPNFANICPHVYVQTYINYSTMYVNPSQKYAQVREPVCHTRTGRSIPVVLYRS